MPGNRGLSHRVPRVPAPKSELHTRKPADVDETIELASWIMSAEIKRLKEKVGHRGKPGEPLTADEAGTLVQFTKTLLGHRGELREAIEATQGDTTLQKMGEEEIIRGILETLPGGKTKLLAIIESLDSEKLGSADTEPRAGRLPARALQSEPKEDDDESE